MFKRNRKAAPQISMITRDWNDSVIQIEWQDGARVYMDSRGFMVEDMWTNTQMTANHWTQVWTESNRKAVRA